MNSPLDHERRPAATERRSELSPSRKLAHAQSSATAPVLPEALPWAKALIAKASSRQVPDYGTAEWAALPDADPAKVAATVIAAEAWRTYWAPEERALRLRLELDALQGHEEPAVWTPEIVAEVKRTANRPSFAELCDRRGEPEKAATARQHEARMREVA